MRTYIALLRGINVGGKNSLPMSDLRQCLTDIGLKNARSYIQSGNVAFESNHNSKASLCSKIQAAILKGFGFSPSVLLLSTDDLKKALDNNPFARSEDDEKLIHLFFLASAPDAKAVRATQALAASSEECAVVGLVFYLYAPDGVGRSKLAAKAEKALGVDATARNLRSARKILDLAEFDTA